MGETRAHIDRDIDSIYNLLGSNGVGEIVCILLANSYLTRPKSRHHQIFAIVSDGLMRRLHLSLEGRTALSCVSATFEYFQREVARSIQDFLIRSLSSSVYGIGDRTVAERLQLASQRRLRTQPPNANEGVLSALRSQGLSLFDEFDRVFEIDQVSAGIVLSGLLKTAVEYFFAKEKLWRCSAGETLAAIDKVDMRVANALRGCLGVSGDAVGVKREALNQLMSTVFGEGAVGPRDSAEVFRAFDPRINASQLQMSVDVAANRYQEIAAAGSPGSSIGIA